MKLMGIDWDNLILDFAVDRAISLIQTQQKSSLFFFNSDCLYKAQKDEEYRNILNSAELVLPDGIGLRIIVWIFGGRMIDNCNGTDFSPILMERAAKKGFSIFFLGGKESIAEKAAENIRKHIPNIKIVGTRNGFFDSDDEVISKINGSRADILFVAMGVPLQEKWIARNRERLNPRLCLGVGALFDYLSCNIPRAPKFMRLLHLEWLWRIFIEPRRMFKRYIIDGLKLFWLVFKQKLAVRKAIKR